MTICPEGLQKLNGYKKHHLLFDPRIRGGKTETASETLKENHRSGFVSLEERNTLTVSHIPHHLNSPIKNNKLCWLFFHQPPQPLTAGPSLVLSVKKKKWKSIYQPQHKQLTFSRHEIKPNGSSKRTHSLQAEATTCKRTHYGLAREPKLRFIKRHSNILQHLFALVFIL